MNYPRSPVMCLRGAIILMNPGPYRPLYVGAARRGGPRGGSFIYAGADGRPMAVARAPLGPVRRTETKDRLFYYPRHVPTLI